ncbi:MAG: cbb3-type cytochrome c oxidase N-terminal domain-containing protein [Bacteroidota bacterium]
MKRMLTSVRFWAAYALSAGLLFPMALRSQTPVNDVLSPQWIERYQTEILLGTILLFLFFILVILFVLYRVLRTMLYKVLEEAGADMAWESPWKKFLRNMTQAVPIEEEGSIVKHEYDGIIELDNKLPPWWVAMFYVTIIFAAGYLVYTELMDTPGSDEAYAMEMKEAEEAVNAYLLSLEEVIDENNVYVLTDEARLKAGQDFFEKNCGACHGKQGEGLVGLGPNLTDDYWLHGGNVKSMFTTVKYGIKATSMIAWGKQLTPTQMHNVVSYAYTLHGTNPETNREAEGDFFERNPAEDYQAEDLPGTTDEEPPMEVTEEVGDEVAEASTEAAPTSSTSGASSDDD